MLPWTFSGIVEKIGILGIPTEFVNGYCKIVTNFPSKTIALFALFMNTSLQFFVPLLIILCLYVHILVAVRRRSRQIAPVTNQHQAQSQNIINQTTAQAKKMSNVAKNVTKTLMTVTLFFALCWSFNSVYFILAVEGSFGFTLSSQFYYVSSYLVCANQIINPFLYALQYKQFQAQTAKICCRGKCTKRNIIVVTEGTVSTQMTTYWYVVSLIHLVLFFDSWGSTNKLGSNSFTDKPVKLLPNLTVATVWPIRVFPKWFYWIHLLCKRPGCYHSTTKTHVRDRIFKLFQIHASVIYQIRQIHWIQ